MENTIFDTSRFNFLLFIAIFWNKLDETLNSQLNILQLI